MSFYHHCYGSYFDFNVKFIAAGLFFLGIYLVSIGYFLAIILPLLAIVIFICQHGIEIDFTTGKYRFYTGFEDYRTGKWYDLPVIDYISVYRVNIMQRISRNLPDKQVQYSEVQVNIIAENKERITAFVTDNYNEALTEAGKLAAAFNCHVIDLLAEN